MIEDEKRWTLEGEQSCWSPLIEVLCAISHDLCVCVKAQTEAV
jgi:hypothetical protein